MSGSPSFLANWIDCDFWNLGAFITSTDETHVTFGKGGRVCVVEKFLKTPTPVFYLKDFYKNSYLAYIPESYMTVSKANVLAWINGLAESQNHISPVFNDDDSYEKDFALLKSSLKSGLEKVVLISRETYQPFEGKDSILRLFKKAFLFGAGLPYGLWNNHYGVIGSTPEILYNFENAQLNTFALAGTARLGQEEELLHSKKDLHEHQLVVKDISEKLSDFVTEIKVHQTEIHPFKSLIHLKTQIEATTRPEVDFTDLVNTLSPTAALGGYPKTESLKFLQGTNYSLKYPIRYFGSALGLISESVNEFLVSIRNIQWEDQHMFIESGGGIVEESKFEKELEEIHLKRNTIRQYYL